MKFPIRTLALVQFARQYFRPPRYPLNLIMRVTAAHSTPATSRNKATLFLKMRAEKELHLILQTANRANRADLTFRLQDWP
jgi:hypothetical protein